MPFWKSLLGGSSSSSKESGSSGSGSSSSLVNPGPSSSSSSPSTASSSGNTGSSSRRSGRRSSGVSDSGAAAKDSSIAATSSSSSSRKARAQSHPPPATAAASQPQPVPVPSSSDSSNHRDTNHPQTLPLPIGSSLSKSVSNNTTSGTSVGGNNTDLDIDTEGEDNAIPDTPFSSGHSPSHARHKFPGNDNAGGSVNGVDDNPDETLADSGSTAARTTSAFNPGSVSSNLSKVGSSSSLSSRSNANNNNKPDIPTTHTILANPLPQPSSGLAAAISSVLPSSSSLSTSVGASSGGPSLGNGKASSSTTNPDGTPRTFDIDDMIQRLLDAGYSSKLTKSVCLKNSEIAAICSAAREVFLSQPTLIELSPPVKIVGDVHGQYSDLIRLFEMCGFPPKSNYLFLGDYVDRGKQSLETILLLLCYKVKYPENFFLLRGNHECANVTRVYGFYDECKRRCNIKIWKTFIDVFNCLPITALVAGKIFCVHGGLSPSLSSMDDIRRISRPTDVPDYGLLNDLLWSDPSDTALDWEDNERGVSYCFGKAVIQDFLAKYDFDLICRAHMVVEDGYEFWNERTLVTIFSAPNYCGEFDNFGACMEVSEELLCSFILLKPLDGAALKKELAKGRKKLTSASSS